MNEGPNRAAWGGTDDLDPLTAPLQAALRHRASGVTPAGRSADHVRHRVANRRRRRAAATLAVASALVLGGLAAAALFRDDPSATSSSSADRPSPPVPATAARPGSGGDRPPLDAIPLPTIGAYPRDPALGPQPVKVTYEVKQGDTIESIAASFGLDPATVRTQTGGTITVGQVLSLLVGPRSAPPPPVSGASVATAATTVTTIAATTIP